MIRKFEMVDAQELFLLTDKNRSYLRQWLPWLDSCTQEKDTLDFIHRSNAWIRQNISLNLGMVYQNQIVGTISFHEIDWAAKQAEIGYWIGQDFQGQGLVTAACRDLIEIGFKDIGLEEILVSCAVDNRSSRAIPRRLGFREGGAFLKKQVLYGRDVDCVIYRLSKKDWISHKDSLEGPLPERG